MEEIDGEEEESDGDETIQTLSDGEEDGEEPCADTTSAPEAKGEGEGGGEGQGEGEGEGEGGAEVEGEVIVLSGEPALIVPIENDEAVKGREGRAEG